MPNKPPINTKQPGDFGYVGFTHKGERTEVYAPSLYEAIQRIRAHCKPPKSKAHLVHATLCEGKDGEQVTHLPLM